MVSDLQVWRRLYPGADFMLLLWRIQRGASVFSVHMRGSQRMIGESFIFFLGPTIDTHVYRA